ncbi:hypothetical protein [Reinekea marinisedimentorum]|uniref:Uncharacterized protein n=1 Tax=Reinekea marinisedimentorum TaxID=230495 RepID=A0A4R3HV82_9GAMM|nr:hypothetical protein [Reinekea marinisedimentorum]TCS37146.1 hypothetical protein BCF53_1205 [Reinekea marinisedimentorum]
MSTTAESAGNWLKDKNPSADEVSVMLSKLTSRIENWTGDEEQIQGSIDAADVLQSYLDAKASPELPDEAAVNAQLDTSELIPEGKPVELSPEEKLVKFNALKQKLAGSTLK